MSIIYTSNKNVRGGRVNTDYNNRYEVVAPSGSAQLVVFLMFVSAMGAAAVWIMS